MLISVGKEGISMKDLYTIKIEPRAKKIAVESVHYISISGMTIYTWSNNDDGDIYDTGTYKKRTHKSARDFAHNHALMIRANYRSRVELTDTDNQCVSIYERIKGVHYNENEEHIGTKDYSVPLKPAPSITDITANITELNVMN